ncbi:MAG: RluA family pseudouridine synthase [Christensenellales bacterium]|jgi:23S rRNA pseudouridine1911/1915/1917 synthase
MDRRERLVAREDGERLDVFLARELGHTRSFVQNLLARSCVCVEDKPRRANYRLKTGQRIDVLIPAPRESNLEAQDIALDIVYEDRMLAVVNKPKGMVVHPAAGNRDGTLVNALLYCMQLSGINGELRPGIVHRLDKNTSGLLVVAKCDEAHRSLAAQLKSRAMGRSYFALVQDNIKEDGGIVDAPIGRHPKERKKMAVLREGGREAITEFRVLERFGSACLLDISLKTGRTHQIRVHMSYIQHPIIGDTLYGGREDYGLSSQALHAHRLEFSHPYTGEWMEFHAAAPADFQHALDLIRKKAAREGFS